MDECCLSGGLPNPRIQPVAHFVRWQRSAVIGHHGGSCLSFLSGSLLFLTCCRKGVGWLVSKASAGGQPPLVLPFVHSGMERVLPPRASVPRLGKLGGFLSSHGAQPFPPA